MRFMIFMDSNSINLIHKLYVKTDLIFNELNLIRCKMEKKKKKSNKSYLRVT